MASWDSNPYASLGSGRRGGSFSFDPHPTRKSTGGGSNGLTAQQYIAMQLAMQKPKSGSFWDEVKHAGGKGLHPAGWALDKLMRPLYGVATGLTEGQKVTNKEWEAHKNDSWLHRQEAGFSGDVWKAMGHGFVKGLEGKSHDTMSGFLKVDPHTRTFAKRHRVLAGAAGFGLDIAADPLTYVTGGAGSILTHSAEHAALVKAGSFALHGHDDLDSLKAAKAALARGGKDYSHRHALAVERISQLEGATDAGAAGRLHLAQNVAMAEQKRVEKFLPQLKFGSQGHGVKITPTRIGGKQVVPALPKLDNFIAKTGRGAGFRNKFIRAADETPESHAARITRQHIAEEHARENTNMMRDIMKGTKLSKEKALKALHYGETHKGFIQKTKHGYRINEGAISALTRSGKLDKDQVHFLRRWFKATEALNAKDKSLGLSYGHTGEAGHLYVPHLVDKLGAPLADLQKNTLTKAGFQYKRGKSHLSVLQMAAKADAGELGRNVETDPWNLLAHTARSRAQKQADMSIAQLYAKGFGIKTRIVDTGRMAKVQKALDQVGMERSIHGNGQEDAMAAAHNAEQEFLHNHEAAFGTKLSDLEKTLRSHKFRNNHALKKANVARLQKQIIKLHEKHISDLEAITKGKHAPLNAAMKPHLDLAAQHTKAIGDLDKQSKQLETELRRVAVGKKNKLYSKAQHVTPSTPEGVDVFKDEHGHPLAFHPDVAHAITKYQKIASGEDQAIEDFSTGFRKYMAKWKLAVTSVNPGYRIRNSMSDVWAMYLSGVPMHLVPVYAAKAQRLSRIAADPLAPGHENALKQMVEAYHHGILSGLYQGDVQAVAGFLKYSGGKRALVKQGKPLQAATKLAQDFNAHVENWGRMTHYLYRRQALHESAIDASFKVKAAHFDYEDLTPFEQRKMKMIAPFYTWTRKNLPFQLKMLVAAPGKFAALPKFMAESEEAAGPDNGNIIPDYIKTGLGFHLPFGKHNYFMPQIGAADLSEIDSPSGALQRVEGLINPAVRTPFELATNKNLYTGADIKSATHERNPVSGIGASLLSMIPGSDVGTTSRKVGGKTVQGPGANPYYAYLLGQIPALRQIGLNYSGINKKKNASNALSYFGGVSVQHVDPATQKMIESIKLQDAVKKKVTSLRDEGRYPRAKPKKSKHQKQIDQALYGRIGR